MTLGCLGIPLLPSDHLGVAHGFLLGKNVNKFILQGGSTVDFLREVRSGSGGLELIHGIPRIRGICGNGVVNYC